MKLFVSWLLVAGVACVSSQVLLYASKRKFPGLFGGNLVTTEKGEIQVNVKVDAHCYHSEVGLETTDMAIKTISVDDLTRSVLMLLKQKDVKLLKGHTCQIDQECKNSSVTMLINEYGTTDDFGPFAMHNGEVYFVNRAKVEEEISCTQISSKENKFEEERLFS